MKRRDEPELRWWLTPREGQEGADHDPGAQLCQRVVALVKRLYEADQSRRQRLERAARLYGPGLDIGRWQPQHSGFGALSMNAIRALTQTASSSLLQHPPPRPWFLTDGADYELQQRSKGMTKLALGVIYQTRFDEQARGDTLLSAALGTIHTKVLERDGAPCLERVFPWELLTDERDAYDGKPRSLYQVSWVDRAVLRGRYAPAANDADPEGQELDENPVLLAIEDAGTCGFDDDFEHDTTTDQVCVLEAWHLPSSKRAKDGRHVICTDKGVLVDEPWEDQSFPFASFRWGPQLTGFFTPGIADEIWTLQYEINLVIERIRQMLHTVAVPRVWLEEGSKVRPGPLTNQIGGEHYYRGAKPIFETARAVAPELWQYLEYLWSKCFALLGISELAASALKPAGVDSGKAMRIYADLTSGRMAQWSHAWQEYYLEVCRQLVRLMRRLSTGKKGAEVTYLDTRRKRLERVRWEDVSLEEDEYVLQCFPVSALPSSPTGRIQMLDEWKNAGVIDESQYRKLLDIPDLDAELDLMNGPREAIDAAMQRMLYGDGKYLAPTSFDDLALCLKVANLHLLRARLDDVPADRQAQVLRYLVEAKKLLDDAKAAAAPPPPPGPPPGMPPGAPPLPPDPGAMGAPLPPAPPAALPAAA